jgi:lysozyme
MKLSHSGREKLKALEGFSGTAYTPVPGDRLTIGYGFTKNVKRGDRMTLDQADKRLIEELEPYEAAVFESCSRRPNQSQFDAMTLLCFNIGLHGFQKSTVLKAHNRGDYQAAARAFALWNKSSGVVYAGLTRRRALEASLYLEFDDDVTDMPQTVDAETKLTASPINKASVIAGGTAAAATVSEVIKAVTDVKTSVAGLGEWLLPVALFAIVAACGYVVWQRVQQRKGGWA